MDVAQWMEPGFDAIRAKRLMVGFVLGGAILAGTVAFIASATPKQSEEEEESVDVVFGDIPEEEEEIAPDEEEPEPEPEPPPPVDEPPPPGPVRAGPRAVPIDAVPTAVPTTEAEETDAPKSLGPAQGDPNANPGFGGDAPRGGPPPAPVPMPEPTPEPKPKPKPKKKKKKKKPMRITEGMTPPKRVSGGGPSYPASAKSQGIEGTVVVVYVVTESGAVRGAKAVRGPAALRGACVAAVSGWRFTPAKDANGNPVSARRIAKFPFRIKTK